MGMRGHEYVEVYDVWVYYTFYENIKEIPWLNIFEASGFEPGYVLLNKVLATLIPWPQMILFAEAAFCVFAMSRFIYLNSEYPFECIPLDAIPISTSPAFALSPSVIFDFSTTPTLKPARSYSSTG